MSPHNLTIMSNVFRLIVALSCLADGTLAFDDRSRLGEYVTSIQIFRTPGTSNAVEVAVGTPGSAVNLTLSESELLNDLWMLLIRLSLAQVRLSSMLWLPGTLAKVAFRRRRREYRRGSSAVPAERLI
jgi:hypothetical protein